MKKCGIAALIGLAVGICTLLGQSVLPAEWNFLANSGAIWLVPAFLIARLERKTWRAILLAMLELECCVLGYYAFEALWNGHALVIARWPLVWMVCGVIGGILLGVAAHFANGDGWLSALAKALLPAVFLSEGLNKLLHLQDYLHMIPAVVVTIVLGVGLYFAVHGNNCGARKNWLGLCAVAGLGLIFYELLFRIVI